MKNITEYWRRGLAIGLTQAMDEREKMHLFAINGFSFIAIASLIVLNLLFLLVGWNDGWNTLVFIPVVILSLYCNSIHAYRSGRFIMVFFALPLILLLAIQNRHTGEEYALITIVCNSVLFYRDIRMIVLSFALGALCYSFYTWYDRTLIFVPDPHIPYNTIQNLVVLISTLVILVEIPLSEIIVFRVKLTTSQ